MINGLSFSWYKILSAIEMVVAMSTFIYSFKRQKYFIVRLLLGLAVLFTAVCFFPTAQIDVFRALLLYVVIFLLSVTAAKFCYKASWQNLIFCAIAAYLLRHLAYILLDILIECISALFDLSMRFDPYYTEGYVQTSFEAFLFTVCYLLTYFIVFWFGYYICASRVRTAGKVKLAGVWLIILTGSIMVFALFFSLLMSFNEEKDLLSTWIARGYGVLSCLVVLCLQFSKLKEAETNDGLVMVRNLLEEEQRQYAVIKQSMDMINIKCHDIKHMIGAFHSKVGLYEDEFAKIENSISILASVITTGNETLDMVLTDKIYQAERLGITLTCIADGALLSFMKPSDVYSLVGNALNNAINAVQKSELPVRSISFFLQKVNNMAFLQVENYFKGQLSFVDGLPQTTSGDCINHGYGMQSMRTIAQCYDATMTVNIEQDEEDGSLFQLNILFPLRESVPKNV